MLCLWAGSADEDAADHCCLWSNLCDESWTCPAHTPLLHLSARMKTRAGNTLNFTAHVEAVRAASYQRCVCVCEAPSHTHIHTRIPQGEEFPLSRWRHSGSANRWRRRYSHRGNGNSKQEVRGADRGGYTWGAARVDLNFMTSSNKLRSYNRFLKIRIIFSTSLKSHNYIEYTIMKHINKQVSACL